MKKAALFVAVLIAIGVFCFFQFKGETESVASVSGKVTYDGVPVPEIMVVFKPKLEDENKSFRLWAMGVTDAEGKYSLTTQAQQKGALVGTHMVRFEYMLNVEDEKEKLKENLQAAKAALAEEQGSEEDVAAAKKAVDDFEKRLSERPKISDKFRMEFDVPESGSAEANFELKK